MKTTDISHHLTDAVLMAYSAGTLPEAFSLVVACHVSLCPQCRGTLEGLDAMGGAVLEQASTASLSEGALAATLAKITNAPQETPAKPRAKSSFPVPLQDYVGGGLESVKWRRVGGGVKQAILPTDKTASARLLFIPAGTAVPDHSHNGLEMTLVLEGAFSDEIDRFARGDVEFGDEELTHTPIAEVGADCICLAATDAPLKFKGIIPRLLQPIIGI